ncbi:hypothetical protein [Sphingomonas jatrophae]|uniref:Uncharacterized protein n=1 Tax=Sphingomonas jatrophae TaxID=1166337 RepID=A0A1I6L2A2_9SPHN|nr:hypothetical protein [Sphingomonas jatrophae]SFR97567.1 hypothetical protein SAMN05192580_2180 [Sphingomonas jatrophae]
MTRPPSKRAAVILKHPARIFRCWQIVDEGDGTFTGILCSRLRSEVRTETGALALVREAIEHCYQYRGAPVWPAIVPRKREAL